MLDIPRKQSAGEWLTEQVESCHGKVRTYVVELARALLARNPANRKISITTVDKYARDIGGGSWAFNGEPIIISADGFLNDGQHRCEAVIAAQKSIQVVLVIGTDRESRLTIDQGRNRLAGDYLGMDGYQSSNTLAAAASNLWQYLKFGRLSGHQKQRPTRGEVLATVSDFPRLVEALQKVPSKGSDIAGGRGMLIFCRFIFAERAGDEAADEFISSIQKGDNLSSNSPILYARNRLIANRGRLRANERAEIIFRAWGAWRRRETPSKMPILDGVLPVVER